MAPRGANTKKESGRAKKAENENKKKEAAAAEKASVTGSVLPALAQDTYARSVKKL